MKKYFKSDFFIDSISYVMLTDMFFYNFITKNKIKIIKFIIFLRPIGYFPKYFKVLIFLRISRIFKYFDIIN